MLFLFAVLSTYGQNSTEFVLFQGKIANRNSDSIVLSSGRSFKKTIKLNKKGEFKDKIEIPATGLFRFFDGTEGTLLFLKNGYDLKLAMDAKQFDESIVYKGEGAKENNYLAQKALLDEVFQNDLEALLEKDEAIFANSLEKKKSGDLEKLGNAGIDEELASIVKSIIEQESAMLTQYYNQKKKANEMNGKPSPSFSFENHKGGITKLEDFKGKYVYIDVWATWCAPCRAEIPFLKKIEEEFKGKNIEFVSISIDTKKDYEKWKKFVSDKELGGVQLVADNDWNSDFVKAFGINGIPRFILVGPDGNVVYSDAPRPSSEGLSAKLEDLLN